jgi:hypothetical protein
VRRDAMDVNICPVFPVTFVIFEMFCWHMLTSLKFRLAPI